MSIRFPSKDYIFKYENYGSLDHAYNDDYKKAADEIRTIYPELQDWPNWACVEAYMSFGEDIHYCGNPYNGEPRKEEFLAYLYAEQELDDNGYFIREDGSPFTHYDLDGLDRIWAIYDKAKLTGNREKMMIFNFKEDTPKGKLKEFGSMYWVKNNKIQICIQTFFFLVLALFTGIHFFFVWALLPLLSVLTFMIGEACRFGAVIQSIWYLPVLFWQARNEII